MPRRVHAGLETSAVAVSTLDLGEIERFLVSRICTNRRDELISTFSMQGTSSASEETKDFESKMASKAILCTKENRAHPCTSIEVLVAVQAQV